MWAADKGTTVFSVCGKGAEGRVLSSLEPESLQLDGQGRESSSIATPVLLVLAGMSAYKMPSEAETETRLSGHSVPGGGE